MKPSCHQFLIATVCVCFTGLAAAQSRVVWLSLEGSPQPQDSAAVGERAVKPVGPGEQGRMWLVQRLPDFKHMHDVASVARIEKSVADDSETYCYANALRTRWREANALFREPVLHRLPGRVIIRVDRQSLLKPHLNADGQVQMRSLIDDAKLRGAVTSQRRHAACRTPQVRIQRR